MKVELKSLELTNYRNIKHASYDFDGDSKIVGDNRIGKTNTLEAIVWLLTGKLLNGSSDIAAIKPMEDTKSEVRVEGAFQVGDNTILLRKEYGEEWTKTRGTSELVFKGHYLKYYYNGVQQKTERDFWALLKEDFGIKEDYRGIDLFQMLVNPFYLGDIGESKDWTNLRTFIISLIGDVQDSDVFAANSILFKLEPDLKKANGRIDEVKKRYANEIKGLNEQLIGDDSLIKHLEEVAGPTPEAVEIAKRAIKEITEDIAKLQSDKSSDSVINEIDKQINEKKARLNELIFEENQKSKVKDYENEINELNFKYRNLLSKKASAKEAINSATADIRIYSSKVDECMRLRTEYIKRLREIDAELALPVDTTCPYCGHELEGDKLEEAIRSQHESLEKDKEQVLTKGKENKRQKEYYESLIYKAQEKISEANAELEALEKEIDAINTELENVTKKLNEERGTVRPYNPEIDELYKDIDELRQKRECALADNKALDSIVNQKISEKYASLELHQMVINDAEYEKRQREEAVHAREKKEEHARELASLEQKAELINLFIKTKLEMLDERVERVFGNIKFQLIKENINGGYDPICKPYIYDIVSDTSTSVTWKSGSKSERVITGIAIAEKIKTALGLPDLPYLFDEGGEISTETFNTRFKTESQLICVKVLDNITTPMVMKL